MRNMPKLEEIQALDWIGHKCCAKKAWECGTRWNVKDNIEQSEYDIGDHEACMGSDGKSEEQWNEGNLHGS